MKDDKNEEFVAEPDLFYYADEKLEVVRYETKSSVVYALPDKLPKSKKVVRQALEEILRECANDGKERIMTGNEKNVFPTYLIDARRNSDEEVLLLFEDCLKIIKASPIGRKIRPIAGLLYALSAPSTVIVGISNFLHKTTFLPSSVQGGLFLGLFSAAIVSDSLYTKYRLYDWDARYVVGGRFLILHNGISPENERLKTILGGYGASAK